MQSLTIDAPSIAESANILVPHARAKVSLRIPPGETTRHAAAALRRHLETRVEFGAEVTLHDAAAFEPFAVRSSGPVHDLAREAFSDAYGKAAVGIGVGGSIPFIALFADTFPDAAVLVTGVGDPSSRWHGIDESLHLGMWQKACLAEALLLERLGSSHSSGTTGARC